MIPLTAVTGNVAVAFAVLSYAGTLTVTVTADIDAFPDAEVLVGALQDELDALTQRQNASEYDGTSSRSARPTIQFSAQNRIVAVSSR